jgi:kindlin 2
MAACKLASQGKTMADSSYVTEVESLKILLSRQQPALSPALAQLQFDVNVNAEDFVAPRYHKRIKNKLV